MTTTTDRVMTWAPRVIIFGFAALLTISAADVLDQPRPLGWIVMAVVMHLIPVALVVVVAIVAWRYEWIGGLGAATLAILFLLSGRQTLPWRDLMMIAGPLALVALLYTLNALRHRRSAPAGH